jgi:ABC-2 type transport system ATP-binding protein
MEIIAFSNVSKTFQKGLFEKKVEAVRNCSFRIEHGLVTGFIGPNGAGKTTSIKMMLGLVKPSSGNILVSGRNPCDPLSRKEIAYISEQPYFYGHLTVKETLRLSFDLCKRVMYDAEKEIALALEQVGLAESADRKIGELSKGMQQRVGLAQVLVLHPGILILDEPFSGVDPPGRRLFRSIFRTLVSQGVTIFFSTHIIDDIESFCRNIIVMSKGSIIYEGSVEKILEKGVRGVDITTVRPSTGLAGELTSAGCEITVLPDGRTIIFIPSSSDREFCQRKIFESGLFIDSISKRTTPLEDIIYGNIGGFNRDSNK